MTYFFGDYELNPGLHELRRDGVVCAIEPQVFDFLLYLVENRDRMVSRDELDQRIWAGRIVSEASLSTCLKSARRAIGDNGKKQNFIRTFPRRGVRFIAVVEAGEPATDSEPALADGIIAVEAESAVSGRPSIAVLLFENLSSDNQDYLAHGIAQDLLTNLSHIHELFVVARHSSFSFKDRQLDVRQVARELGVRYVLDGSLRSSGTRIRISAQLIDGTNGSHLWAEKYDQELSDILELQDEITSKIATALEVRLTEGQQARIRRSQTASIFAWHFYQEAQFYLRQFTPGNNALARETLHKALELDPLFVSALSLLAWTYLIETRQPWSPSRDESLAQARTIIERAMSITDENPDVLSMQGIIQLALGNHDQAETINRRAVALGPNMADIRLPLALTLNMRNKADEAVATIKEAMRLCPIYPDFYLGIIGISYRLLKMYDNAIDADTKRLQMNLQNPFSDIRLAAVYSEIYEMDKAQHHVEEALRKQPQYRISHLSFTDNYEDPALMSQYEDLLRRAGLPE